MPHDSLTTAADVLVDKRGFGYADAYAKLGDLASTPVAEVSNPEVLEASTAGQQVIEVDLKDPARTEARMKSRENSAMYNHQTGDWDRSAEAIAKTTATNARGRAIAEKAHADYLAQKTE